ncbi:hypothetical protein PMAYCL1PPCAC_28468 [Pristionchus mayeri]|uniref:Uncharacterized protein n=1 Tax=Pristionchus mayeri TaxID=1317129 RepID=A0AAN5IA14_9BILA|nr:hypothetical protein PMAYCL1PPCAC_28468 [Pristionchus mayeri]
MDSNRRARKREQEGEIDLWELTWSLEDDVIRRRRAKSEPPRKSRRAYASTFVAILTDFDIDDSVHDERTEVTWSEQSNVSPSKKSKRNKRRKIGHSGAKSDESTMEETDKPEITVLVEEETPSIYMTPPKSPDHEMPCSQEEAKQRLMDTVNEYRSHSNNNDAITLISQLAQMAYCYNNKERPGESDYDNIEQLVFFYTDAPQIRDPPHAADEPRWFLPQKQYLMRRAVRGRLYGAVSLLRSQQQCSTPSFPEEYRSNPMIMTIIEEATALGRNCHTLALLLEDLHSIPDL